MSGHQQDIQQGGKSYNMVMEKVYTIWTNERGERFLVWWWSNYNESEYRPVEGIRLYLGTG